MPQRCIVIGASAGGFEPVVDIAARLPANLPAPVFVAMHVPAYYHSHLPEILSTSGPLSAIHPKDGQKVEPGFIYVAPPNHHLLLDDGYMTVEQGPKENGFRPSIDALFRSAAYSYGPGTVGVVLSGTLNDGTSGLWTIKRLGGVAVVQDPDEARYASMPRSALEYVDADYQVRSEEIPGLLTHLANEPPAQQTLPANHLEPGLEERIAKEVRIASGTGIPEKDILELGEFTPFACPECQGALVKIMDGKLARFRCHTGHGYTSDALLEAIMETTGEKIWQATRGLPEVKMLLEHMGRHIRDNGDPIRAKKFFAKARELEKQASRFQETTRAHQSLNEDNVDESNSEQ